MKIKKAPLLSLLLLPLLVSCSLLVEKGTHNAGKSCMWPGCHGYEAPAWQYAGTVFTSTDRSAGAKGVTVTITDSTGELRLKTNSAGNFYTSKGVPSLGYSASISDGKETLAMESVQTNGACNSCHTPGAKTAPLHIDR